MPRRTKYDWESARLGERPDPEVAAELGCSPGLVLQARQKRGIPAFKAGKPPPDPVASPTADLPDPDLSSRAGIQAYLARIAGLVLREGIHPEAAKAAGTIGRAARDLLEEGSKAKGGGGKTVILPTVVETMDDVRRLREANEAERAAEEAAPGVH